MTDKRIVGRSAATAVLVVAYVALVAWVMVSVGGAADSQQKDVTGPVAFLLLFVLSAAVVGSLVLGKPILLYLDGEKAVAVKLFVATLGWLIVFTFLALLIATQW